MSNSLLELWRRNRDTNQMSRALGVKAYKHPFTKALKVWFWLKLGQVEMAMHESNKD